MPSARAHLRSSVDVDADEEPTLLQSLRGDSGSAFSRCKVVSGASPAGHSQILSGSSSGAVLLWPLAPGRPPRPMRLGTHRGAVTCVAASASGGLLVSSSMDASVMLWKNQAMKQSPATLRLHFSPVRSVDISSDDQLVVTASDDKLLKLASVSSRRFVASLVGHSNWVRSARFSPDAQCIASGSDDRTVRLWDTERHTLVRTWHDQAHTVHHVDFEPQGSAIVACTEGSVINLFDTRSEELRQHYNKAHGSSPITQVVFHPTQDLLLSSSTDRTLRIWDLRAGRLRYTLSGHERAVHSCSWESTGGRFVSCDDQLIHLWSLPVSAAVGPSPRAVAAPAAVEVTTALAAEPPVVPPHAHALRSAGVQEQQPVHKLPAAGVSAFEPEFLPPLPRPPVAYPVEAAASAPMAPELSEALARTLDTMVSQMDMVSRSLASMEARLESTEAAVTEISSLTAARKAEQAIATREGAAAAGA